MAALDAAEAFLHLEQCAQAMASFVPNSELLHQFQSCRGLHFLGAGASTGEAPFGAEFMLGPSRYYLTNAPLYPAVSPIQNELTRELIAVALGGDPSIILPDRLLRLVGTDDFLCQEILQRMPDYFARLFLMHDLSVARHQRRASHNYLVFRFFRPALLMNYNHDGLATDICGDRHRVISVHGIIPSGYGSPQILQLIQKIMEYNELRGRPDNLLMLVSERHEGESGEKLLCKLRQFRRYRPDFIALIGYSFSWDGTRFKDHVSLDYFVDQYREFPGRIYVINPQPRDLQEMLAERLRSNRVIGVPAYWNLLSHAFMQAIFGHIEPSGISDFCKRLLDDGYERTAFPLNSDYGDW